jgi:hypothetical protein
VFNGLLALVLDSFSECKTSFTEQNIFANGQQIDLNVCSMVNMSYLFSPASVYMQECPNPLLKMAAKPVDFYTWRKITASGCGLDEEILALCKGY